ncbi:MAG: hypothetical protein QM775_06340 [Pirellulales bacterium]
MIEMPDVSATSIASGFVELAGRGKSAITGTDAVSILHKFCTNDIVKLPVGHGCEAFVLDAKGQIQFYVIVHRRADELFVELPADTSVAEVAQGFAKFVGRYVIVEKVTFTDRTSQVAELFIAGENAAEIVAKAFDITPPDQALEAVDCPKLGADAWLARSSQAEIPNFTLFAKATQLNKAKALLAGAGATEQNVAWYEQLRIAARFPLLGRDILEKALPQELDRNTETLNFRKGCYLGQETVARLDAMGHVNKSLTLLHGDAAAFDAASATFSAGEGSELRAGEAVVGRLNSLTATADGGAAALAMVRTSHRSPGTILESAHGRWRVAPRPAL